jgi:hypothetical protein
MLLITSCLIRRFLNCSILANGQRVSTRRPIVPRRALNQRRIEQPKRPISPRTLYEAIDGGVLRKVEAFMSRPFNLAR